MESSAINAPHPDSEPDEAELFFGSPAADAPDPGDFGEDAEKMAAEGERYREERGEEMSESTQTAETTARLAAAEREQDDAQDTQDRLRAISERRQAETIANEPEAGMGERVNAETGEVTQPGEPMPPIADEGDDPSPEKKRGAIEREYIVFQEVALTAKVLQHLLDQLTSGENPEPQVAYIELHRSTVRSDKLALTEAYTAHQESLGSKCALAAVSARQFKSRTVEPRKVVKSDLQIT